MHQPMRGSLLNFALMGVLLLYCTACTSGGFGQTDDITPATPEPELPLPVAPSAEVLVPVSAPPDASKLIGLDPKQVQMLIGAPSLLRRDGPVQIALYEPGPCVLDLFYFGAQIASGFTLQSIEARDSMGDTVDHNDCLAKVLGDNAIPAALRGTLPDTMKVSPIRESGPLQDIKDNG